MPTLWLNVMTALLWAASGWFWLASARASRRAKAELAQLPVSMRMAPGPPGSVSTDWLAAYRRTEIPVNRSNFLAAAFAAAAGLMSFVQAAVPVVRSLLNPSIC
jgi:hypothetical protein